jgi:hypothetical protein
MELDIPYEQVAVREKLHLFIFEWRRHESYKEKRKSGSLDAEFPPDAVLQRPASKSESSSRCAFWTTPHMQRAESLTQVHQRLRARLRAGGYVRMCAGTNFEAIDCHTIFGAHQAGNVSTTRYQISRL